MQEIHDTLRKPERVVGLAVVEQDIDDLLLEPQRVLQELLNLLLEPLHQPLQQVGGFR